MSRNDTVTKSLGRRLQPARTETPDSATEQPPIAVPADRVAIYLAVGIAVAVAGWSAINIVYHNTRFALFAREAQVGVEALAALASLFSALILSFFPNDPNGQRLRWVASGFVVMGLGGLAFGYFPPLIGIDADLNTSMYASTLVNALGGVLFVLGLARRTPPPFSRRWLLLAIACLGLFGVAIVLGAGALPRIVRVSDTLRWPTVDQALLPGLTGWHWGLGAVPLVLAIMATAGAALYGTEEVLSRWLVVAMGLLAGAQVQNLLWPSAYGPVLTGADLLRVAFAIVISAGAIIELRRIATERSALLAAEQEQSRRLIELAVLKADFTAMVAHELANPLAAIRGYVDMLATRELSPDEQTNAFSTIRHEVSTLLALVEDIRIAASVEREDFAVRLVAVPTSVLLADAAAYAKTLPGDHPLTVTSDAHTMVLADAERIGQVLRNLLTNAAHYSEPGTPIELRAFTQGARVRLAVIDQGSGIAPEDMVRIFAKFGRGRDAAGRKVPGAGLGLYLSRRIVRAHGSELQVESTPGAGSTFAFELEAVR